MTCLVLPVLWFAVFALYAGFLWWLDRYEKEPLRLLAGLFVWGAVPAVLIAALVEVVFGVVIRYMMGGPGEPPGSGSAAQFTQAVILAPVIEESLKGLILLLPWVVRHMDSPLDGVLYGSAVGLGFAFTEDILYVISAYIESGAAQAWVLFFFRSVIFGLNHSFFTSFIGIAVSLAVLYRWWVVLPIGWVAAVGTHTVHNILVISKSAGMILGSIFWHWISGFGLLGLIVGFWWLERRCLREAMATWPGFPIAYERLFRHPFSRWQYCREGWRTGGWTGFRKRRTFYNELAGALLAWYHARRLHDACRWQRCVTFARKYGWPIPPL